MRVRIRRRACITGRCNYRTRPQSRWLSNEETRNDLSLHLGCRLRCRCLATRTQNPLAATKRYRRDTGRHAVNQRPFTFPSRRFCYLMMYTSAMCGQSLYTARIRRLINMHNQIIRRNISSSPL